MKAERFRFDGSETCEIRKLPCGAGSEKENMQALAARTAENLEKMAALQTVFMPTGAKG